MATVRVTDTTTITEGQWVCKVPTEKHAICDAPKKVARVAGKRLHLQNLDGSDASWILSKSVLFVCDTWKEAEAVILVSEQQRKTLGEAVERITSDHAAMIDYLIAAPAVAA